ncbi:hypothetical protein [Xanthomonas oryzae pv. oryzae MAFF 311018]|nr:hypothetical protein [Xanthomonas oryzae pv. oryzae MAFF 311018]
MGQLLAKDAFNPALVRTAGSSVRREVACCLRHAHQVPCPGCGGKVPAGRMGAVPGTSGQPPTRLSDQGNSPRWDFQPMAARPGAAMIGRWLQIRLSARDLSARRRTLARSAGRRLRRHLGAGRHTARSGHAHRRRTRQRALQRHLRKRVGLAPGRDRPGRRRQRHHRRQHPSARRQRDRAAGATGRVGRRAQAARRYRPEAALARQSDQPRHLPPAGGKPGRRRAHAPLRNAVQCF